MAKIGACGDNCDYCPRFHATQSGNKSELEKVKDLWVRVGLRDGLFPAENLACNGCSMDHQCAYAELRQCVFKKGIENCGACDLYPCTIASGVINKSEDWLTRSKEKCSAEEYELLKNAFCMKKRNLDAVFENQRT